MKLKLKINMCISRFFCKLNIHKYKYSFIPFSDQPFQNDPMCVIEGVHLYKCTYCGKEKGIGF